jgi:hypothetical protein
MKLMSGTHLAVGRVVRPGCQRGREEQGRGKKDF